MDDPARGEIKTGRCLRVPCVAAAELGAGFEQSRAGRPVDGSVDSSASQQGLVRRVDDGVDLLLGDVANDDFELHQLVKFPLNVRRLQRAEGPSHSLYRGSGAR